MCGGLGQATTELLGPRRVDYPIPKVTSTPSLSHLEAQFPPVRDSFGVGIPPPGHLLAPNLPAAFQPNISDLVSVLLFVSIVLAWNSVFISRFLHLYSPTGLCFSTFVLFSMGLILMFNEKPTEKLPLKPQARSSPPGRQRRN